MKRNDTMKKTANSTLDSFDWRSIIGEEVLQLASIGPASAIQVKAPAQ